MYFRLFNTKLPKMFIYDPYYKWSNEHYLEALSFLYNSFLKEFNSFKKSVTTLGFKNKEVKYVFKGFKKFHKNFQKFIEIQKDIFNSKLSCNEYFKRKTKHTKYCYRWFYTMKKRLLKLAKKRIVYFINHLYKMPIRKKFKYKYSQSVRLEINNYYYKKLNDPNEDMNKTTLWMELSHNEILQDLGVDFSQVSYKTLSNILKEDKRYGPLPREQIHKKHLFRKRPKKVGLVQLDIKVFGRIQTGAGRYVNLLDAIEVSSRLAYGIFISRSDTKTVMEAVKEIVNYFESFGIKIQKIRTDNAMMFQHTNFVQTNEFNKYCYEKEIIHEFIPLGEPECDGCIERFHRTLDEELVKHLKRYSNILDMQKRFLKYLEYYNFKRYLHYNELKDLPKKSQYMKPIDALKYFNCYNHAS